jgi:nitrogen fixation NifU-like protein
MDYSSEVQQRARAPADAERGVHSGPGLVAGEAGNRTLNAWVRFELEILDGTIRAARFRAYGCPHTIAAASWIAEYLEGRAAAELRHSFARELAVRLEVPVEKLGKLLLMEDALEACVAALEVR